MKWWRKTVGLIVLTVMVSGQSSFGGYMKGLGYYNPHSASFARLGTRFQARWSNDNGRSGYFAALNFESDFATIAQDSANRSLSTPDMHITPVEFYMDYHFSSADLRVGQQFIFWGATDWVNPTDVINPWDFENLSSETEDYRIPVLAGSLMMYLGNYTIQAVLVPAFTATVIPIPQGTHLYRPPVDKDHLQGGIRIQSFVGATDVSFAYFSGFNHLPTFRFTGMDFSTGTPFPTFKATYSRQQMVGVDFVRTVNQFALKGESAWLITPDKNGTDIFEDNASVETVLGMDYIASENFSLNFQYINHTLLKYSQSEEQDRIDQAGMTGHLIPPEKMTHSFSGRLAWDPFPYITSQVIGVYHLKDRDSFLLGFLSWQPRDAVSVTVGTVIFSGSESSEYGRLDNEDLIFLEIKQSF